jgi:hypothetical protein
MVNNDKMNDKIKAGIQLDRARIAYYEKAIAHLEEHIKKLENEAVRPDNLIPREYLNQYRSTMHNLAVAARNTQQKLKAGAAIAKERIHRAMQKPPQ